MLCLDFRCPDFYFSGLSKMQPALNLYNESIIDNPLLLLPKGGIVGGKDKIHPLYIRNHPLPKGYILGTYYIFGSD